MTLRGDTVVETRATLKVVKSEVSSNILEDRESNPFVVTSDASCNFHSNGGKKKLFVATLLQQFGGLLPAVSTLKQSRYNNMADRWERWRRWLRGEGGGGVVVLCAVSFISVRPAYFAFHKALFSFRP